MTWNQPRGQPCGVARPARNHAGAVQAHQSQEFGRNKTPLVGGGAYRWFESVITRRALWP